MKKADQTTNSGFDPAVERVLAIDPDPCRMECLARLLGDLNVAHIVRCSVANEAMEAAAYFHPDLVFVAHEQADGDGLDFVRAFRRSALRSRRAPIILLLDRTSPAILEAARDSGVHEFLVNPLAASDLRRRIKTVLLRCRDWVNSAEYVGPDRRQFNTADRGWQTR